MGKKSGSKSKSDKSAGKAGSKSDKSDKSLKSTKDAGAASPPPPPPPITRSTILNKLDIGELPELSEFVAEPSVSIFRLADLAGVAAAMAPEMETVDLTERGATLSF